MNEWVASQDLYERKAAVHGGAVIFFFSFLFSLRSPGIGSVWRFLPNLLLLALPRVGWVGWCCVFSFLPTLAPRDPMRIGQM